MLLRVHVRSRRVGGAHLLANGGSALSLDVTATVGGVVANDEDILLYDPSGPSWSLAFDASALDADWAAADVDAVALPEPGAMTTTFDRMGPVAEKRGAARVLAVAALALVMGPAVAGAQISLVGESDPYVGDDVYGDVWGEGNHAYIGTHKGTGVGIVDISDPSAPTLVATYAAGSGTPFKDVKVRDGIGYFAGEAGGGLHIVDLADPAMPALLAHVTAADGGHASVHNVFVAGGFAYQADSRTPTIVVLDVSDPGNPFFVRNIITPDSAFIHDVTVIGERLYASGWGGFTYIYDVTDVGSLAPSLLGSVPTGAQSHSSWATSDGNLLISAQEISDGDVKIFDITNPASAVLLSSIDRASLGIDAFTPHNPVLFDDTLLFVAWYEAGVVVIDLGDPADPQLLESYDTFPGGANDGDGNWGVYPLLGLDRVLLSDMDAGLVIVDATAFAALPVPALQGPGLLLLATLLAGFGGAPLGMRRKERL